MGVTSLPRLAARGDRGRRAPRLRNGRSSRRRSTAIASTRTVFAATGPTSAPSRLFNDATIMLTRAGAPFTLYAQGPAPPPPPKIYRTRVSARPGSPIARRASRCRGGCFIEALRRSTARRSSGIRTTSSRLSIRRIGAARRRLLRGDNTGPVTAIAPASHRPRRVLDRVIVDKNARIVAGAQLVTRRRVERSRRRRATSAATRDHRSP